MSRWVASAIATAAMLPVQALGAIAPDASVWLQIEYESASATADGESTGTSSRRQALIRTIVEENPEGTIFEFDLPRDEDGKSNSNFWYFPARVLERPNGTSELLNEEAIEARIDQWLIQWNTPREACGLWSHGGGFPYKVDCDPQSILKQIEPFELLISDPTEGAEYSHPLGAAPGSLKILSEPRSGFFVTVALHPDKARAEEVESSLILSQMMGDDLTREQAEANAARIGFEGWITVEFDLNASGQVERKTERANITIRRAGEAVETKTVTTTVSRLDIATGRKRYGY